MEKTARRSHFSSVLRNSEAVVGDGVKELRKNEWTGSASGIWEDRRGREDVPTAFSSMMFWALVFAADMAAEWVAEERKKRDRNAMVGNGFLGLVGWVVVRRWRE